MFETRDDRRFGGVVATYGPATDAPLRALADADPEIAQQALYWIEAESRLPMSWISWRWAGSRAAGRRSPNGSRPSPLIVASSS